MALVSQEFVFSMAKSEAHAHTTTVMLRLRETLFYIHGAFVRLGNFLRAANTRMHFALAERRGRKDVKAFSAKIYAAWISPLTYA
jgi:hypothetical protein